MSKRQERQRFIRFYREQSGETEIDMKKVAAFAKEQGWEMPRPNGAMTTTPESPTAPIMLCR